MMKETVFTLLLLVSLTAQAQDTVSWEFTVEQSAPIVEAPIDVTQESSVVDIVFKGVLMTDRIFIDDLITKLTFKGYNPGEELTRHVKVYLKARWGGSSCVFDGDCTIPSGGSAEAMIPLLELPFSSPCKFDAVLPELRIESSGTAVSQPLIFEQQQDGGALTTLTATAPVKYLSGTVADQDGNPVKDACVCVYDYIETTDTIIHSYYAVTDEEGRYTVRVEHGNNTYFLKLSANGYADYLYDYFFRLDENATIYPLPCTDFVLTNRLDFKADQLSTIILPEAPDASWGRYYRPDRISDEGVVIFEREPSPQANVPYVIFPNEDFSISLSGYDMANLPEAGCELLDKDKQFGLHGTYQSRWAHNWYASSPWFCHVLDNTPDCTPRGGGNLPRVGAFRAYLIAYSNNLMFEESNLLFVGEMTSVTELQAITSESCVLFDLQGRRVQGQPRPGVYVRNGRKQLVH